MVRLSREKRCKGLQLPHSRSAPRDYWPTTSPRQSRAASSLPGWTTAMHCWVAHRRRLSTSYSAPRTTWPESTARAGVAPTPGRCFTRYTGFRWGSGSPINWLYWLTRCGPQPLKRISASWYRPVHHLGFCALPILRCSSFLAYTPNWPVALILLLLHPPGTLYLLTFDCAKTFWLSNATWKPIFQFKLT